MSYSLSWSVITETVVRRERWPGGHKLQGIPLVYPGQEVVPDQPVLRLERKGRAEPLQSAPRLALPAVQTTSGMKMLGEGAAASGNDTEMIPAGLRGRVVDITPRGGVVIESYAALLQGTVGAGKQVAGILTIWQGGGSDREAQVIPPGAILVIPGPLNFALLRQAFSSGVTGIIASSLSTRDFEGFLRTDLIQLLDSPDIEQAHIHLPPMTLLLTEGLGAFAMPVRIMNLLSQHQGSIVLLSGMTSVRQGIFPELIISLPINEMEQDAQSVQADATPTVGVQVRVCSGEHEGKVGLIDYIFTYQQVFPSGIRARAVRLRIDDGSLLTVPLTHIERIG